MKAQFKYSDKVKAKFTIVIGQNEVENGIVALKNMETGDQNEISMDKLSDIVSIIEEGREG